MNDNDKKYQEFKDNMQMGFILLTLFNFGSGFILISSYQLFENMVFHMLCAILSMLFVILIEMKRDK